MKGTPDPRNSTIVSISYFVMNNEFIALKNTRHCTYLLGCTYIIIGYYVLSDMDFMYNVRNTVRYYTEIQNIVYTEWTTASS